MYDLIIIGAGPAGLAAALYAGRYRLNSLILEKMAPGGQIILSADIENFPGFPGGISTQELVERFKKQVEELGISIAVEEVLTISASSTTFNIKTPDNSYQTKSIIIATGASAERLGVKGEDKFIGRGELRASQILVEKAKSIPKINFILETIVEEIQGENKVEQVLLKNLKTSSKNKISCQGVFVFVGISPNTAFLKNLLEMDEAGFIITDQEMKASEGGIFACGDCRKKSLYQVITACGDGAVAANSVHKYLLNQ